MISLNKALDYKITNRYSLTIKVEDNAPAGKRLSTQTTVEISVTFTPDTTASDPEVLAELQLTFADADYNSVVQGKEEDFIAEVNRSLSLKYPNAIFTNFAVREGSIIVTFDMITRESQQTDVLIQISNDVNSPGGLQLEYNGTTITTNELKRDGVTYKAPGSDSEDSSTVVSCLEISFLLSYHDPRSHKIICLTVFVVWHILSRVVCRIVVFCVLHQSSPAFIVEFFSRYCTSFGLVLKSRSSISRLGSKQTTCFHITIMVFKTRFLTKYQFQSYKQIARKFLLNFTLTQGVN